MFVQTSSHHNCLVMISSCLFIQPVVVSLYSFRRVQVHQCLFWKDFPKTLSPQVSKKLFQATFLYQHIDFLFIEGCQNRAIDFSGLAGTQIRHLHLIDISNVTFHWSQKFLDNVENLVIFNSRLVEPLQIEVGRTNIYIEDSHFLGKLNILTSSKFSGDNNIYLRY